MWDLKYAWGFEGGKYRGDDGEMHDLGGVVWEGGRNASDDQIDAAGYKCGAMWSTHEKNIAVENG